MKTLATLLAIFSFLFTSQAQTTCVKGKVGQSKEEPALFASVILLTPDSQLVKAAVTDEQGEYRLENIKFGSYRLKITSVGFTPTDTLIAITQAVSECVSVMPIYLKTSAKNIKEVEVWEQRSLVERKADRLVLNVSNSLTATGNSLLEVIAKAPGVMVDNDGNITLKGKTGTRVLMDGKPMQLSAEALANLLRAQSSATVDKIEVITNPSASFDAQGSAGIINIITKKGKEENLNGSIYVTYGQGRYEKINTGFSLNKKTKKANYYANYDFSFRKGFHNLTLVRKFSANEQAYLVYDQKNYKIFPSNNHTAKAGVDWSLTKNTTLGFQVNAGGNWTKPYGSNTTSALDGYNNLQSFFVSNNQSKDEWQNASVNTNIKHKFKGNENHFISADIDAARFRNQTEQFITTDFTTPAGNILAPSALLKGNLKGQLSIYSVKTDYKLPINTHIDFEAGLKASKVKNDNDVFFTNSIAGVETIDTTKTNHFLYDEAIQAAYVNSAIHQGKWQYQLGLRVENTVLKGQQLATNSVFNRNYLKLFPSAFITYTLNKKHDVGLNYSRRIERPSYDQLNPFIFFIDPTTYKQGNPWLQPQFSNSIELTHTYKSEIVTSLSYSKTLQNMTAVLIQDDARKVTIQMDKNIGYAEYWSYSLVYPVKPYKWWSIYNNLSIYYGTYSGNLQGYNLHLSAPTFYFTSTHNFTLPNNMSAELNGYYKSSEAYGIMMIKSMYAINLGVKKEFTKQHLSLKLSFNDITYGNKIRGDVEFGNINEIFIRSNDTRVISLTANYMLGKGGAKSARQRSGADEELRRAVKSS